MPLPAASAWLLDYVTAREIFLGASPVVRQKVIAMCVAGTLKFCGCEAEDFKKQAALKQHFLDDQNCRCNLNGGIVGTASALPAQVNGKHVNPADKIAKLMVACALVHGYGIVSSKSGMFVTPVELGSAHGLTCLTLTQFIALI